jgi:hypothetical protein
MNEFDRHRFLRLFNNDFLQQWKKIWIATLALVGMGLIAYLTNVDPQQVTEPAIYKVLFPIALIGGGLVFTSTIFADLHHPLQRFHYLTLPCSNLERFLSRYLLSAPLYYFYVLICYAMFDWMAALIAQALMDRSAAAFAPFEAQIWQVTLAYFLLHALMFCGAIYFRSHAAIKTVLAVVLIGFGLVVVQLVAVRIFYWSYFTSFFKPARTGLPAPFIEASPPFLTIGGFVLCVWVLFIAYRCLREHEVQGGL